MIYIIVTKDTKLFIDNFSNITSILSKIAFLSLTALLEEFSWRGFALFELQKSWSPNKSATVTSVVWAIWHIPMWYVMNGSSITIIILSLVMAISTGIIIALFYNASGGIVFTGVLAHLFLNTSFIWDGITITLYVINDIVLVIGAAIAIIVFRCGNRYALRNAAKGLQI